MKLFLLLLIVAVTILTPLAVIHHRLTTRKKDYLHTLYNYLGKSAKLSEHQLWNNILIGVNRKDGKLYFLRKQKDKELFKMIDLSKIYKCKLLTTSRNLIINKVILSFIPRDHNSSGTVLEIYNTGTHKTILPGELQLAIRWENIANSVIEDLNSDNK